MQGHGTYNRLFVENPPSSYFRYVCIFPPYITELVFNIRCGLSAPTSMTLKGAELVPEIPIFDAVESITGNGMIAACTRIPYGEISFHGICERFTDDWKLQKY